MLFVRAFICFVRIGIVHPQLPLKIHLFILYIGLPKKSNILCTFHLYFIGCSEKFRVLKFDSIAKSCCKASLYIFLSSLSYQYGDESRKSVQISRPWNEWRKHGTDSVINFEYLFIQNKAGNH